MEIFQEFIVRSTVYLHSFMMCLCVSVVESIFIFIVSCIHWNVLKTYLQLDSSFIFRFVLIFTEMVLKMIYTILLGVFSRSQFQF